MSFRGLILHKLQMILNEIEQNTENQEYYEAFMGLRKSKELLDMLRIDIDSDALFTLKELELNFLMHQHDYVLDSISKNIIAINNINLSLNRVWSKNDIDYLKLYVYNFEYMSNAFLKKYSQAKTVWKKMDISSIDSASDQTIVDTPPYTKKRLQKIFKEDKLYEQYSSEDMEIILYNMGLFWGEEN